jgi:hypothetical protein
MNDETEDLEQLLDYVRDSRAFDFTGYKRASRTASSATHRAGRRAARRRFTELRTRPRRLNQAAVSPAVRCGPSPPPSAIAPPG